MTSAAKGEFGEGAQCPFGRRVVVRLDVADIHVHRSEPPPFRGLRNRLATYTEGLDDGRR
jgi:hypothetical protein